MEVFDKARVSLVNPISVSTQHPAASEVFSKSRDTMARRGGAKGDWIKGAVVVVAVALELFFFFFFVVVVVLVRIGGGTARTA